MNMSIGLNYPIKGSEPTVFEVIPNVTGLSRQVRFSFRDCNTDRYCIKKLDKKELKSLYNRLEHFEQVTWKDINQMDRRNGFSIEKKSDSNHKMLENLYPKYATFLHFRVNNTNGNFRVFGAIFEDLCCILLFDPKGKINH